MADRLVIEIDGNSSGLTKALSTAQSKLTQFNTNISTGNKALTSFLSRINSTAAGIGRLSSAANNVRTSLSTLNASLRSTNTAIARLSKEAASGAAALRGFGTALGSAQRRLQSLSTTVAGAGTSMTSLNRRLAALGATVTATNAQMRTFMRTMTNSTGTMRGGTTVINNYGRSITGAGEGARRSAGLFGRLHNANLTLMEGFRRHVAQITALRTLTYQAIFWFGPLVYSIIKVNAQYEKQMQLLKNLSGLQGENAKAQWAEQTRQQLIKLAQTNPFSLDQITETFVRLKVTGIDPLNGSMQTLMDSIAAFGGSNEELQRAGIAIQQMVGKAAVSMEELRQQLGEHIPDAMKAMAIGMGMSMADFYNAVKKGTVESVTAIGKMLAVLHVLHYNAAQNMMNTWNGLMARLGTAWQNFVARLEHGVGRQNTFIQTLKNNIESLITFLNTPAGVNFAISVEHSLAKVVSIITTIIKLAYEWRTVIIDVAKTFAIMWGGRLIVGTILSVYGLILRLGSVIKGMVILMRVWSGATTAAAGAAMMFGRNTQAAVTATNLLSTSVSGAATGLAGIAVGFLRSANAAALLAIAIYKVVGALNAKSAAQRNAALVQSAAEGGVYASKEDQQSDYNDLQKQVVMKRSGIMSDTFHGIPIIRPWTNADSERLQAAADAYAMKSKNTEVLKAMNVNQGYRNMYNVDSATAVQTFWSDKLNNETDYTKRKDLQTQASKAMGGAIKNDILHLRGELSRTSDPEKQKAIQDLINEKTQQADAFDTDVQNLESPNKFIANKKKKKKKKKGDGGLDSAVQSYEQAFVDNADLKHQLDDLIHGTNTDFDEENARREANLKTRGKTVKQIKEMKEALRDEREELKKSIKVEQAVIDIQKDALQTRAKTKQEVEDLALGYNSINAATKHYKEELELAHQEELKIAQSRLKNGLPEQIEQYKRLVKAVDDAVKAKEAQLVVEAALEAKQKTEDYQKSIMTPRNAANYDTEKEIKQYTEALQRAQELTKYQGFYTTDLADANDKLSEAYERLASARTDDEKAAAHQDIVVEGQRKGVDEDRLAAIQAIPYLQQYVDILHQQEDIRNKLGGAGGPLFDWALPASQAFQDLGKSVGELFAGQMDTFIDSLMNGKAAFGDFVKSIIKGIIAIIIKGIIAKAILSALGFTGASSSAGATVSSSSILYGNDFTGQIAGLGHTGMVAGGTARSYRSVNPSMFSFAERYHTGGIVGLRPNEVPIIAKRGEGVFTEEQMKALGQQQQPNNVQINVINQSGTDVSAQRGKPQFDGEKWIESIILKKMATPGPVRDGLNAFTKR